jgi:hypothetical protein
VIPPRLLTRYPPDTPQIVPRHPWVIPRGIRVGRGIQAVCGVPGLSEGCLGISGGYPQLISGSGCPRDLWQLSGGLPKVNKRFRGEVSGSIQLESWGIRTVSGRYLGGNLWSASGRSEGVPQGVSGSIRGVSGGIRGISRGGIQGDICGVSGGYCPGGRLCDVTYIAREGTTRGSADGSTAEIIFAPLDTLDPAHLDHEFHYIAKLAPRVKEFAKQSTVECFLGSDPGLDDVLHFMQFCKQLLVVVSKLHKLFALLGLAHEEYACLKDDDVADKINQKLGGDSDGNYVVEAIADFMESFGSIKRFFLPRDEADSSGHVLCESTRTLFDRLLESASACAKDSLKAISDFAEKYILQNLYICGRETDERAKELRAQYVIEQVFWAKAKNAQKTLIPEAEDNATTQQLLAHVAKHAAPDPVLSRLALSMSDACDPPAKNALAHHDQTWNDLVLIASPLVVSVQAWLCTVQKSDISTTQQNIETALEMMQSIYHVLQAAMACKREFPTVPIAQERWKVRSRYTPKAARGSYDRSPFWGCSLEDHRGGSPRGFAWDQCINACSRGRQLATGAGIDPPGRYLKESPVLREPTKVPSGHSPGDPPKDPRGYPQGSSQWIP